MAKKAFVHLSRRERQIMDIVYQLGQASVHQVLDKMDDAPSYSAVRAEMRILEEKGHLKHKWDGPRYVYLPKTGRDVARKTALRHIVDTYFDGSASQAAAALIELAKGESGADVDKLAAAVDKLKK